MYRLFDRQVSSNTALESAYKVYMGTVYESKEEWDARDQEEFTTFPSINTSMSPYMSPVDGSMIHNSKDLREHNARNNVIDTGTEYNNHRQEYLDKTDAENEIDEGITITNTDEINQLQQEITNG